MGDTVTRRTRPDGWHSLTGAASHAGPPDEPPPTKRRRPISVSGFRLGGLTIAVLSVVFYYWIGALVVQRIADDPAFAPPAIAEGERETLAMVAALIVRETQTHHWVSNDPAFLPGWLLTRMAAFQQGIVGTLAHTMATMADQTHPGDAGALETDAGRALWDGLWSRREADRAAAAATLHRDLRQAADLLASPGDAWILDLSKSFGRQPSAETQYGAARTLVESVNRRLADGSAIMPDNADLTTAIVDRFLVDLHAALSVVDARLDARPPDPDRRGDGIPPDAHYYDIKGRAYAMALILRALGRDTADRLSDPVLAEAWNRALAHLTTAATLRPLIVSNGALDALLPPNHWVAQGYLLQQAARALADTRAGLGLHDGQARL